MTGKEVVDYAGIKKLGIRYSRTQLDRKVKDGSFPKFFKLGAFDNSPRVWWLSEVIEWLEACAAKR